MATRGVTLAVGVACMAAVAEAFAPGAALPLARSSRSCTPLGLRMQTFDTPNGQPPSGRGSDSDVANAYFKEMEERKQAAVEAKNAPKAKTLDMSGDAASAAWKADKEAEKAKQVADTEAKMAGWIAAAAAKKKAEEEGK